VKRQILLLEPDYKNKYPPMGLMKLATYHRLLGDNVRFYKGDLNDFIIQEIYEEALKKLYYIDNDIVWETYKSFLTQYIKTGKKVFLNEITSASIYPGLIYNALVFYRRYYVKKNYFSEKKWDRVCVTTLFTFYWDVTIKTIEFAKLICKNQKQVWVGGVLASVIPEHVEQHTGIKPWVGQLDKPGIMDDNDIVIENMYLDYSILDEIDYRYPESNAYYAYMTRGCIRNCDFCVVPTIEPDFNPFITLNQKIEITAQRYGEQRNLLLLDNNVLASPDFPDIIKEIKSHGFYKNAKYYEPNWLDIAIRNLEEGANERGCLNRIHTLLLEFIGRLKGQLQQETYNLLSDNLLKKKHTMRKESVLAVYPLIKDNYEIHRSKAPKRRYVDFNQGIDARLINPDNMKLLSEIPIYPLRIAFDHWEDKEYYKKAILLAAKNGIKNLSNYLLYNHEDLPIELYYRLKMNVSLCESLGINIYSFPMKYHPIKDPNYFHNRDYLGKQWNRKFIRAVQAVLNCTKGKIGRGKSFFEEAFGRDEDEFFKIMYMPEAMIIYREKHKMNGETGAWWAEFQKNKNDNTVLNIIEASRFNELNLNEIDVRYHKLLSFYINCKR